MINYKEEVIQEGVVSIINELVGSPFQILLFKLALCRHIRLKIFSYDR